MGRKDVDADRLIAANERLVESSRALLLSRGILLDAVPINDVTHIELWYNDRSQPRVPRAVNSLIKRAFSRQLPVAAMRVSLVRDKELVLTGEEGLQPGVDILVDSPPNYSLIAPDKMWVADLRKELFLNPWVNLRHDTPRPFYVIESETIPGSSLSRRRAQPYYKGSFGPKLIEAVAQALDDYPRNDRAKDLAHLSKPAPGRISQVGAAIRERTLPILGLPLEHPRIRCTTYNQ